MRFTLYLALLLATLAPPARAATISFSDIPSTNVVNASDLLLLDSHLGGTNYATRTITVSSLPAAGNWTYPNSTNATLAGVASASRLNVLDGNADYDVADAPSAMKILTVSGNDYDITLQDPGVTNDFGYIYFQDGLVIGSALSGEIQFRSNNLIVLYGDATLAGVASAAAVEASLGTVTPFNADAPTLFWARQTDDSPYTFVTTIDATTNAFGFFYFTEAANMVFGTSSNAVNAQLTVNPYSPYGFTFSSGGSLNSQFPGALSLGGLTNLIADNGSGITYNGNLISGGNQTPWTATINGAGHQLTNVLKAQLAPVSTSGNVSTWNYNSISNSFNSVKTNYNGSWDDTFSIGNGTPSTSHPSLNWVIENFYNTAVGVSQIETYLAFDPDPSYPWFTSHRPWSMDIHLSDPSIDSRNQVSTHSINDVTGANHYFQWSTATNVSPVTYIHFFDPNNRMIETVATNGVVTWSASGPAPKLQWAQNGGVTMQDDGSYFQVIKPSSGISEFVVRHSDATTWLANPDSNNLYMILGNDGDSTGYIRVNTTSGADSVHLYGSDSSVEANWSRLKSTTTTPTGAQIGAGRAIYWVSNAVAYVSVSTDGSAVTTKQVAP